MSQQKEKRLTLNEISWEKVAAKPEENAKYVPMAPRRKYGAHSGIIFNFKGKKQPTLVKPFNFDTESKNEKRKDSLHPSAANKQTNKEVPVEASMESLKISDESEKGKTKIRSVSEGSAPEGLIISGENKNINLPMDAVKSLRAIAEPLPQPSNLWRPRVHKPKRPPPKSRIFDDGMSPPITAVIRPLQVSVKIQLSNTTKPEKTLLNAAKSEPSKVAKVQPTKPAQHQSSNAEPEPKVIRKKYGAHAGLKFKFNVVKPTTVVQPFSFETRIPRPRGSITHDVGVQTQRKERTVSEGSHQKK